MMDSTEAVSSKNPFASKAKLTPGIEDDKILYKFAGIKDL